MEKSYTKTTGLDEFAAVREEVERTIGDLKSPGMAGRQHSALETFINERGEEYKRRLLQSCLDREANNEEQLPEVVDAEGVVRNRHRDACQRNLMSRFGEVVVTRKGYSTPKKGSLFPLDCQLNLTNDKYSFGLRQCVAEEVAYVSYDHSVSSIARTTGAKLGKLQAEELAVRAAQDFVSFYQSRQAAEPEETNDPLIITLDGKGIVMRQESLREATRKAAEHERHKIKGSLSKGAKLHRKRMATVSAVYSIERYVRTPEDIMNQDTACADKKTRPRARNKRVWASVEREAEVVADEAFREAIRRDPDKRRLWAVLVDGAEQQLKNIHRALKQHGAEHSVLILDFIHAVEYLWDAARAFEFESSEITEKWVRERMLLLLKGRASHVAAGLRRSATLRSLSPEARKPIDTCADYFLKYSYMLRYDQFLAQGFPIATGVIEGACRSLIKDRMDITGARWGLAGAEAVLKLRSLHSSKDFDEYWSYHQVQELDRNHVSHYDSFPLCQVA